MPYLSKLDPNRRRIAAASWRLGIAWNALGLIGIDRSMMLPLLQAETPWPALALSGYLRVPRTTLLRRLKRLVAAGLLQHEDAGWLLTDYGRGLAARVDGESLDVALGVRAGFSRALVQELAGLGLVSPHSDVFNIEFSPCGAVLSDMSKVDT